MTPVPSNTLYTKICDDISNTVKQLDYTKFLTPKNLHEENETFLNSVNNGKVYNPLYTYEPYDIDFRLLKTLIQDNLKSLGNDPFDRMLRRLLLENEHLIEMYEFREAAAQFTDAAKKAFGFPSPNIVKEAYNILTAPKKQKGNINNIDSFSANDLREKIVAELERNGYSWKVLVNENQTTKVTVDEIKRTISINGRKSYSANDLSRLVVHEVGTHVVRAENGRLQPYSCFISGLANSLATEEGLAVYAEYKNGLLEDETLRLYAGRVVATHLADTKSFFEIFSELVQFLSEEQSLYITQRVKKGLGDTSSPGGFIKDYVYLDGYFAVSHFMQTATEYTPLYVGSVGLNDLEDVEYMIQNGLLNSKDIVIPDFLDKKDREKAG